MNDEIKNPYFGYYTYEVTPRYIADGKLVDLDSSKTVRVTIDVSPYDMQSTQIGFTRGFVSSVAYLNRFGLENNKVPPKKSEIELLSDIKKISGKAKRWTDKNKSYATVKYTFEEQYKWQSRQLILDFLDEVISNKNLSLKVFTVDLDEPEICKRLLKLAREDRLKIIVDDEPNI